MNSQKETNTLHAAENNLVWFMHAEHAEHV